MSAVTSQGHAAAVAELTSDDELAREVLGVASMFTAAVTGLAGELRDGRPELAAHLEQLAAEVAGCVLDAVGAWPQAGRR